MPVPSVSISISPAPTPAPKRCSARQATVASLSITTGSAETLLQQVAQRHVCERQVGRLHDAARLAKSTMEAVPTPMASAPPRAASTSSMRATRSAKQASAESTTVGPTVLRSTAHAFVQTPTRELGAAEVDPQDAQAAIVR